MPPRAKQMSQGVNEAEYVLKTSPPHATSAFPVRGSFADAFRSAVSTFNAVSDVENRPTNEANALVIKPRTRKAWVIRATPAAQQLPGVAAHSVPLLHVKSVSSGY